MGKEHFCFFQTAATGNRTPNSGVKGSGANHYPWGPRPIWVIQCGDQRYTLYRRQILTSNLYPRAEKGIENQNMNFIVLKNMEFFGGGGGGAPIFYYNSYTPQMAQPASCPLEGPGEGGHADPGKNKI